ncbi:MAG: 50S ribosomal protein L6 [Minisyncoccia bacterium]
MSRLGKKPIKIPENVQIEIKDNNEIIFSGPKGKISKKIPDNFKININDGFFWIKPEREQKSIFPFWGLWRSLINNFIQGVSVGFEKKLELQGIGFRASLEDKKLRLEVGFSHPVYVDIPEGISVSIEKNIITVSGIDKEKVGQFASNIRKIREPDAYKGKGIRYFGEKIKLKPGKKVISSK